MRRGELLKLPELKVTETMRKTVGEDQGHQVLRCGRPPVWSATYYWFYRAKKTGTVLEIDVFTRDMILAGTAHPEYRLFLLEENKYYTYDNLCEKWRTAKIDNLSYMEGCEEIQQGYWYSSRKVWIREEDRKRISEFCHNGKEEPRAAIARWQNYSKGRKEIDEIDSEMALVPELPKDFEDFVDREVLPQYLFYDAGRKVTKGYCTHCRKEVLGEDKRGAVDYHDYLKMAEELGYNMRESWILFPKNLEQRHEELIEESREREIKAKEDLDNKKDKKYEKYRKRDSYLEMETEQFVLRLPKRIHEIRQEGNAMHHCVATYIDRVAKGETTILFLRKKQDPETPFYTMEVNNGVMIQCRAKYNGDMTEEVKEFVELFKRKKLKRTERKAG